MSEKSIDELISQYDVEVTLAIGTGELPVELDLQTLAEAIGVEYDPEESPGVDLRPHGEGMPMVTFYRSGKYILRTEDEETLYEEQEAILDRLITLGVIDETQRDEVGFEISNIACTASLGTHFNLSPLLVGLGYDNAEYEPEQFPAVIYRSSDYDCAFSIFSSGKIVFPGSKSTEDAIRYLEQFVDEELRIWM